MAGNVLENQSPHVGSCNCPDPRSCAQRQVAQAAGHKLASSPRPSLLLGVGDTRASEGRGSGRRVRRPPNLPTPPVLGAQDGELLFRVLFAKEKGAPCNLGICSSRGRVDVWATACSLCKVPRRADLGCLLFLVHVVSGLPIGEVGALVQALRFQFE